MSANDRQVGGTHYQSKFQHWDMMCDFNVGYLEATASKYITRWRKSSKPLMDLEKSLHYTEKLYERANAGYYYGGKVPVVVIDRFVAENALTQDERDVLFCLLTWAKTSEIIKALRIIQRMLTLARFQSHHKTEEPRHPGTPEDGGHYERQQE